MNFRCYIITKNNLSKLEFSKTIFKKLKNFMEIQKYKLN